LILKNIFKRFGIGVTSYRTLVDIESKLLDRASQDLEFVRTLTPSDLVTTLNLLDKSKSQFRQDLFVLNETKFKSGGYFVEFGATNGIDISNTFLLETEYLWRGILAEPGRVWENALRKNRPVAAIETLCVWSESGLVLTFNETRFSELSTLDIYTDNDEHRNSRVLGKKYDVKTISLVDLLIKHQAPKFIDYLSIDTEGSEFEILNAFDFNEYSFGVITVEHNFTYKRNMIFDLLTNNGYERKYEKISNYDDWYVKV